MHFARLITIVPLSIIAALLLGCNSERIGELELEKRELQLKLDQYDEKTELEIARKEHAASIFNACNEFYGLGAGFCPNEAYQNGEKAVTEGFAGVGWVFWCVVCAKMAILGAFLSTLVGGLWWLIKKRIWPDFDAAEAAEKMVKEAESRVKQAIAEEQRIKIRIKQIKTELDDIEELVKEKQQELKEIYDKKQLLAAQEKAKSVFDGL